jgi:hydrogenase maturation protease
MKSIRILGVGSFFGADQIGLLVIKRIKAKILSHPISEIIDVEYYDRPGFHLIELVKDAKEIHLIDAMLSGKDEGFIHRHTDISIFESLDQSFSSHGYGLAEALQLAKSLDSLPEKLVIHGIEISKENVITPRILNACDMLAENIVTELNNLI